MSDAIVAPESVIYRDRDFTEDEARRLTADIKAWAGTLWVKLKYAHDGKAYKAMGYSTWVDYLRDEFDISKSQGYRLLAHARTMDQLADAAGLYEASPIGDIPEGQTRGIDLPSVADAIADQVHHLPHDATDAERAAIVTKVIEEHKTTTETSTTVDADTGEILSPKGDTDESPTEDPAPPAAGPVDEAPDSRGGQTGAGEASGDGGRNATNPEVAPPPSPTPSFVSVGELIDWCPDSGQWLTYDEMQRTEATKHFGTSMNRRLPRAEDQDIAGLCPPEARRSAIFAAEVAATYWLDLAADLKKLQHLSNEGRHLAAVEG